MHADTTTSSEPAGVCVIVTPESEGVCEPVPRALADALVHHDAHPHHAPSAYHAITEVVRAGDAERCTLLIVEPGRNARAESLALACMAHAPDVAVWRYEPDDESPVAPYVPTKPGVVPDPIEDEDDDDDDDDAHSGAPFAALRITDDDQDNAPLPGPVEDDTPLVSSEELSMLLGDNDTRGGR